jgi:hypothetical protein
MESLKQKWLLRATTFVFVRPELLHMILIILASVVIATLSFRFVGENL